MRFAVPCLTTMLFLTACADMPDRPEEAAPAPTAAGETAPAQTPDEPPPAVIETPPIPAPPVPEAASPPPAAEPKPPVNVRQDPRTIVYLASYRTEKLALAGWRTLSKASSVLTGQKPITLAVDLGRKGHWVRLYGMAADENERAKICAQLGRRVDECGARNRE